MMDPWGIEGKWKPALGIKYGAELAEPISTYVSKKANAPA